MASEIDKLKRPKPIDVLGRFAPLRARLLELLTRLPDEDWTRPTAAPQWSVKDVAAHLLGGYVGLLSRLRDGFVPPANVIETHQQLIVLVNRLNAEWVTAASRMSPRVICELLAYTGKQIDQYYDSLDLHAIGGPVTWAGPDPAPVWLDLAREFTEGWHHQQQIRDAVGAPPLYDPYYFAPVLDAFVRALPYNFRALAAPEGTAVRLEISGGAGGVWFVVRIGAAWKLTLEAPAAPAADVILPQDAAWRLFTKGLDEPRARALAEIRGDASLAAPIFRTISIIG